MASQQQADAQQHHDAQTAIVLAMAPAVAKLWQLVDPTNLAKSIPMFTKGALALVQHNASGARYVSSQHYMSQRSSAGVKSLFRPPLTPLPGAQQVESTVNWATEPLWSSAGGTTTPESVVEQVQGDVASALEQMVLDVGRNEIIEAIQADREARGWYRVTKANPCSFCAMLATRGVVYGSKQAASFQAHQRVNGRGGDCRCTAEPSFADHHEPSAQVREWQQLWTESTKNVTGMKAKQNAFRRAYDAAQAA